MTVYAEELLKKFQRNQWFLQIYPHKPQYRKEVVDQQLEWLASQGLTPYAVATVGETKNLENFLHINFAGAEDARLTAYSARFETPDGISLDPESCQLFEWDYEGWISNGEQQRFEAWMAAQSQTP